MGKFHARLFEGLRRYYILHQLRSVYSKKLNYLLYLTTTMQILTLVIPLEKSEGYQWNYDVFWPVWYTLNAFSRPDRLLLRIIRDYEAIFLCFASMVTFRIATLAASVCYNAFLRKEEYWRTAFRGGSSCLVSLLDKADRLSMFVLSRLLAIPTIAFLITRVLCGVNCGSLVTVVAACLLLPVAGALIIADRLYTTDVRWAEQNDGPICPAYSAGFAVCELTAALLTPLCGITGHDFLLRGVVVACGLGKTVNVYKDLPFHSRHRNVAESFQGVALIWEAILITIANNDDEESVAADLLMVLGTPAVFWINFWAITALELAFDSSRIDSEPKHARAIQDAIRHAVPNNSSCDSLKSHPRLGHFWLHEISLFPLLWTSYYFLRTQEMYFAKVAVAVLVLQPRSILTGIAVQVCSTRLQAELNADPDESSIQNFLSLNQLQVKLQRRDFSVTTKLKEFYETLVWGKLEFSRLEMISHRASQEIRRTMSLYQRSLETFPKKVTLLQAYASFLEIIGSIRKAEKYANMIGKLLQRKKKKQITSIERLLTDDSKCVFFVVPLTGPHKERIVWTLNSSALGYDDESLRGSSFTLLVPEMFQDTHARMLQSLISLRSVPRAFQIPYRMYLVNRSKELAYGLWKVFGTVERGTDDLIIIASVKLEPVPKEFGILGPFGGVMECTPGFANFVRESTFNSECDMHSKDVVWKGDWNSDHLIATKDTWSVSNRLNIPCVSLYRMRKRGSQRNMLAKPRATLDFRSSQYSSRDESCKMFLSRMSRASSVESRKHLVAGSGEIGSMQTMVASKLKKAGKRGKQYQQLLFFVMLLTFAGGSAITIAIGQTYYEGVMDLNGSISSIIALGMRTDSIKSATSSKELFLINSGFTLFGNETRARADLQSISDSMKATHSALLGNASEATGAFRKMLLEPINPYWRFENDGFQLHYVTLLDLMAEIATRTNELAVCPLQQITSMNGNFMTLYRNGAAEALKAFNISVDAYAQSKNAEKEQKMLLLGLVSIACPIVCLAVSVMAVCQLLIMYERWRKRMWVCMLSVPKPAIVKTLELIYARLSSVHMIDSKMPITEAAKMTPKGKQVSYRISHLMKMLMIVLTLYCAVVSLAGMVVYFYGQRQMEDILIYKPRYVDWLTMRRALTVNSQFHMREAWLPGSISYSTLIPETQTFSDNLGLWEKANAHLEFLHHCFTDGCKKAGFNHLFPSPSHKDWLQGAGCVDCDTSLKAGLTPLIHELVQLSSAARSDLRAGINSDYSKGKKIEKYTRVLVPSLTNSTTLFDDDTRQSLLTASTDLQHICVTVLCVSFGFFITLVCLLLLKVKSDLGQNHVYEGIRCADAFPKVFVGGCVASNVRDKRVSRRVSAYRACFSQK